MFGRILIAAALLALAACGKPELEDYAQEEPALELEEFFVGDITAWGVFQDRFGDVTRRFTVDMVGEWDGETLTLTEDFVYSDGGTEQRIWRLVKTGEESWTGSAEGVIGEATGREAGNAFNWRYTIDLPLADGESLVVDFDDWMWQQDDRTLFNIAYMSKYGVELGRVMIFFRKAA